MSPREPPIRISDASVSRYAFDTHCCAGSPPPRSRSIAGSATLTIDPSISATPEPRIAATSVIRCERVICEVRPAYFRHDRLMSVDGRGDRKPIEAVAAAAGAVARAGWARLTHTLGGHERTRVIVLLGSVLALSSADASTVGASATQLRHGLHVNNTDIGLLVAVSSLVAAAASL